MFEAIIVAGGPGSRLAPLTDRRPKHLLPIAGVPFLAHQLSKLAAAGAEHVVVATSYHADAFVPTLGRGERFGLDISYVAEQVPLGTGGAIKNAARELRGDPADPFAVLNGDQLSGHDIGGQLTGLAHSGAQVSVHVVHVPDPQHYGCVLTDDAGRVTSFTEKSPDPPATSVNAGCYIFRHCVVDRIGAGVVSVEREVFPDLVRDGVELVAYAEQAYWADVGTPQALVQASCDLVTGIARSPGYPHPASSRWVDAAAAVPDPHLVRGGSSVGPGAEVGAGALIEASIVMAGARIGPEARLTGTVVGPGARVGAGAVLRKVCLGDDAVVGARCELPAGVRVGCGVQLPDGAIRTSAG